MPPSSLSTGHPQSLVTFLHPAPIDAYGITALIILLPGPPHISFPSLVHPKCLPSLLLPLPLPLYLPPLLLSDCPPSRGFLLSASPISSLCPVLPHPHLYPPLPIPSLSSPCNAFMPQSYPKNFQGSPHPTSHSPFLKHKIFGPSSKFCCITGCS